MIVKVRRRKLSSRKSPHFISGNLVACDTEGTGLNRWLGHRPYGFSFCNEEGETRWIEFPVDRFTREVDFDSGEDLYFDIKWFYEDASVSKIFHHAKYDIGMLETIGIEVKGEIHETTAAAHACKSNEDSYELKEICDKYGIMNRDDQVALRNFAVRLRSKAKKLGWNTTPRTMKGQRDPIAADYWLTQYAAELMGDSLEDDYPRVATYGTNDAKRTMMLWLLLLQKMEEYNVRHVYDFEMELWPAINRMEKRGVYVDPERLKKVQQKVTHVEKKWLREVRKIGGPEFNPNSGPQKIKYFIDKLGLEPLAYTKPSKTHRNGQPQIDGDFLEFYERKFPMAKAIRQYGSAQKCSGTYLRNYLLMADEDSIIHPSLKDLLVTARFNCIDPNLQNVPKRDEGSIIYKAREPFGPRPGFVWYLADYSQIEARLFAAMANEPFMLQAFANGRDVYQELADELIRRYDLEVTRRDSKDIFLGKLYGLGVKKLCVKLGLEEDQGRELIASFDESWPGVKEFQKKVIREVRQTGEIVTEWGRPLRVDTDFAYKGVDYIMQGNAAELMKRAIVKCDDYLMSCREWKGLDAHIILPIHDELIFEFPINKRPKVVLCELKRLMEDNENKFGIATPVDWSFVMDKWTEKTEFKLAA